MACESCKSGFAWEGKHVGTEVAFAGTKAYVTGESKSAAVLLIADIFGWTLNNTRLLADHFAKEANATVYVPDFYDGEVVDPDVFFDPEKAKKFDVMEWVGRHGREEYWPPVKTCAQTLKAQYPKVAAIGYCWGGWGCFQLGADPSLVDAISTAHPALLNKEDFDNVKVPVQLIAPEHDNTFTPDLKQYSFEALPRTGVQWEYVYFAGYQHGFASRGDPRDESQKAGLERAKRCAVNFFNEFLH